MHLLVGGPVRAWNVFLAGETRKNLELCKMLTCLWPGAQIWFRHKWGKLVTASLLLDFTDWYSWLRCWNEFFSAVFQVLDWSFLVLHFDGNVCNWGPKVIWPRRDWFWKFFVGNLLLSMTSYLCRLKSARIAQLLLLVADINFFSMFSLRGILVCSLKMLVLFSCRIFLISIDKF